MRSVPPGRVMRGLPRALGDCGYNTFSLYPWHGDFLNAREFQASLGIRNAVFPTMIAGDDDRAAGGRLLEAGRAHVDALLAIAVESEPGRGTTFRLHLPAIQGSSSPEHSLA